MSGEHLHPVEWCVDTRVLGAARCAEAEICTHLTRHAIDPLVVELARPLVRDALAARTGISWVTLDWELQLARLHIRVLPDQPLPGTMVAPGVSRAHHQVARLAMAHPDVEGFTLELGVARAPEPDVDIAAGDPRALPDGTPAALAAVLADGMAAGESVEEAAARAGATLAAARATGAEPDGAATSVAARFVQAERDIGGDFHVVGMTGTRIVLANRRCPFGPSPHPGLCRFTSALAGGLAARAVNNDTEVTLDERFALGDHQCHLVIDLVPAARRLSSHRYSWPPGQAGQQHRTSPPRRTRGLRVALSLQLPRDALSVPLTRHLTRAAMEEVGVVSEDADAVELSVSEACANVVTHSGPGDAYEVSVTMTPDSCHIRVVDIGRGFDHEALGAPAMPGSDSEHGRGLALMRALVDDVRFESEPERGTVVHLIKRLHFDESSPAQRLLVPDAAPSPGPTDRGD